MSYQHDEHFDSNSEECEWYLTDPDGVQPDEHFDSAVRNVNGISMILTGWNPMNALYPLLNVGDSTISEVVKKTTLMKLFDSTTLILNNILR